MFKKEILFVSLFLLCQISPSAEAKTSVIRPGEQHIAITKGESRFANGYYSVYHHHLEARIFYGTAIALLTELVGRTCFDTRPQGGILLGFFSTCIVPDVAAISREALIVIYRAQKICTSRGSPGVTPGFLLQALRYSYDVRSMPFLVALPNHQIVSSHLFLDGTSVSPELHVSTDFSESLYTAEDPSGNAILRSYFFRPSAQFCRDVPESDKSD